MKVVTRLLLLVLAGLPVLAGAQEKVQLNTITRVEVKGGSIEIVGDRKPNFTTFTMTDPPRLVIDISEAVFSGVPDEMQVGNGIVTGIRTASYGSDESAIARVLIGFERDVETDLQTDGAKLTVVVLQPGGAAVAAAPPAQQPPAGGAPAAEQPLQAPTPQPTGLDAQRAAEAAQAAREAEQKAAAEAEARAKAEREAQEKQVAEAEARAKQEREAQAQAEKEAADRATAEREAQAKAQQDAAARAAEETQRREEEARAAAAAKQQQQQDARAAAETKKQEAEEAAEAKKREAEEARAAAQAERQAQAEAKKREQEEARAAAQAEREARAEAKKREQEESRAALEAAHAARAEEKARKAEEARAAAEARQQQVASAERPAGAREGDAAFEREGGTAAAGDVRVSGRRKTMTFVGFRPEAGTARIYVRTNEPVRYSVSEAGEREVVLELENTRIGVSNNTRALDTRFFDTAVALVDPGQGPGRTVRVAIKLKEQVRYEARQDGNEVVLEFSRPGAER